MNGQRLAYFVLEAAALIIIFVFWQMEDWIIPHTKIGFFCGDPSLSYPYKAGTIPTEWVKISLYLCPVLIWIIELSTIFAKDRTDKKRILLTSSLRSLKWFIYYYSMFMLLMLFVTLLKNLVGRLRPNFFQLCQPDMAINCSVGQYINSDYNCTSSASEFTLFEIKRSFPSGHATASVYITVFFMRYLEARFAKFRVTLSAVLFTCSIWIVVCCVSRITDHLHHGGDVIAGIIVALPFVFYSCQIQCKGFRTEKQKTEAEENL